MYRLLLSLLLIPGISLAANENKKLGRLQTYEPNSVGITKDQNDEPFLDFKLSLKYPLFHSGEAQTAAYGFLPRAYFSFTGRFGQYIGTRESSPVISKRFNPTLFARYWLGDINKDGEATYTMDIVFGHESNGQSIDDNAGYRAKQLSLIRNGEDPLYANDYISRGWDYIGGVWSHNWNTRKESRHFKTYTKVRHFFDDGLLQGDKEEYNDWENDPEGKPRSHTDGIEVMARFGTNFNASIITGNKLFISYTTGIDHTFKFNTYRAEMAVDIGNLPIMLWASYGYNSDLVDYYRKLTSYGLAVEFLSM